MCVFRFFRRGLRFIQNRRTSAFRRNGVHRQARRIMLYRVRIRFTIASRNGTIGFHVCLCVFFPGFLDRGFDFCLQRLPIVSVGGRT